MNAQAKPREPISDLRLQELLDEYKRQFIRDRGGEDVFDTYAALLELQGMRKVVENFLHEHKPVTT